MPLENDVKQAQIRIEDIKGSLNDFEKTITENFAALGPLLAEPVAQKAIAANKYPTFPFYMTISCLKLIKQEDKLRSLEQEIATYQDSVGRMLFRTGLKGDLGDNTNAARSDRKAYELTASSYIENFKSPSCIINLILEDWHRTVYWWTAAKDNQEKTPSLTPEDFGNVQKEFDLYKVPMEKAEQDFAKLKRNTQTVLERLAILGNQ